MVVVITVTCSHVVTMVTINYLNDTKSCASSDWIQNFHFAGRPVWHLVSCRTTNNKWATFCKGAKSHQRIMETIGTVLSKDFFWKSKARTQTQYVCVSSWHAGDVCLCVVLIYKLQIIHTVYYCTMYLFKLFSPGKI